MITLNAIAIGKTAIAEAMTYIKGLKEYSPSFVTHIKYIHKRTTEGDDEQYSKSTIYFASYLSHAFSMLKIPPLIIGPPYEDAQKERQ